MNVKILCVGKIKEKFYRDAILEYSKRLSKYCSLEIVEVNDEKTSENSTENEINIIKDKEGERILKHIKDKDYAIALAIQGKQQDSVAFSKYIENLGITGNSSICFVIGGSLGLSDAVMGRCNASISFSKMTFPHQLMRVILLEQIYRAMRIMNNEPYHK
ncbi:MAG: 23S rRNA (pseudouridine(1915)-N(3))-methyltransferase RlmH [Pseudobutyrivibrio sp.]|uniref:23S rRNA (pseudouridine(1915)-N(3))-methyltransferase RlmH n=1 Tax=Pseudobutyrivibrio sp. TaxID=2014367 RepID=UPI001B0BB058|nr:23S rRNA (pseudouridine(1915)-N(3))-methyltransferase RlmH [Pseudobutyrivibrio sp.]MBO6283528.1 23S rRNA (pseudouridine(1915)-N(3))-methyltransferase RlmH [Pseudobutyrivibrio sp.]MBP3262291.1 23S rRNA (pseudouridine(1915)-N(3))-methyltransferase RlmH [Pseudobutyrivibrio sp.]